MIAIYITYAITEHVTLTKVYSVGQIIQIEAKYKGIAPKVADWSRKSWQSVLRITINNDVNLQSLFDCTILDNKVMSGTSVIFTEDSVLSEVFCEKIEDA